MAFNQNYKLKEGESERENEWERVKERDSLNERVRGRDSEQMLSERYSESERERKKRGEEKTREGE